jgi:UDP-glucose 4-epimerase
MKRPMRVVVTGGAGFIGSHLVDALLTDPDVSVLVLDNLSRGRLANIAHHDGNPCFQLIVGDVRQAEVVERALTGAEVVYHLAAQSNVMGALHDPRYSFETNVLGTFNVLDAASHLGVRRVVFASSREAYGEPRSVPVPETHPLEAKNTYGASKAAAEIYCRTFTNVFQQETAILRLANVYGPRDFDRVIPLWLDRAMTGQPIEIYGGDQVIDFVWVGQAVEAFTRAANAEVVATPINVGSGTGTPIRELAKRILTATNSDSSLSVVPARAAEVRRFVADVKRMRTLLEIEPMSDPLACLPSMVEAPLTRTG